MDISVIHAFTLVHIFMSLRYYVHCYVLTLLTLMFVS